MKVLSCSNVPLRSTGPSYQEVTDRVLADSQTGFQGQYVQSLMRDENEIDSLEDEFCPLNSSSETTQTSLVDEQLPESIRINVTEDRQNLASLIPKDKNLNDEETVEGISSHESEGSCEFPEESSLSAKSNDISDEIGFKKKDGTLESRLIEKEKPHTAIKRKAKESANLEIFANSIEEPGEMKMTNEDNKCDWCKKMFGQYEWKKFIRHKTIQHTVSCSDCELKFVDEWDLNKHSRKFHKIPTKYDCEVRYDYECKKCLKKSRTLENIVKHEQLKHPYQCQVCLEQKVDHPFSFIDKNGLKHHSKAMHNVETSTNNFKNSDLHGDSNEDFGDCILEGGSNKNDDDLQVVAVVPKIIKGTTRFIIDKDFGIIKKKKLIHIKEEPEMLKMNENCSSQENFDQDVCNREIGCSTALEVDYSTRIINETVQDQNNSGKVQSNVRMATNNNFDFEKNESLVDKNLKMNTSIDEVSPFTGEARQRYQVPTAAVKTPNPSSMGSEGTTPSMGSMSRGLHPAVAYGHSGGKKHDDVSGIRVTQPMPKRGMGGLRIRMTRTPTRGMGELRMRGATGVRFTRRPPGVPLTRGAQGAPSTRGALRVPFTNRAPGASSTRGAPGVPFTKGAPRVPFTRGAPGVHFTRGAPGVPSTRATPGGRSTRGVLGVPSTRGAPGVPSTRGAPGVPSTRGAPGVSSTRGGPGVPSTRGAPGVPSTRGDPGVPTTRRAPGVSLTRGMSTRMPMMRNVVPSRPQLAQMSRRRGLRTRGGSRVGLTTTGRSGETLVRENRPIIPVSSGVPGIRNVKLSNDGRGLSYPQLEGPRRPVVPEMSTADLHYTKKTKNVEVELIELSDDDSSPAPLANPALERLRNCGISVTSLKSSTKPECLQVPPGISMSPVALSCSSNEPRNGESREKASNASNNNRPAKEKDTFIKARSATPPVLDEIEINVNNLSPEQKKQLQSLGLL